MMRIASITYDEARECMGCEIRDEKQISTYILSFQIADHFLRRFEGNWKITQNTIILDLKRLSNSLMIEFTAGAIHFGTLTTRFYHRYSPEKGVTGLVEELYSDLGIPSNKPTHNTDFLFTVFVKLVEIFHARCGLRIIPGKTEGEWEIHLSEQGPFGWVSDDRIAENRFGEKIDITQWETLRPEKAATYIFGFNRFCKHFQCPMK
ncbi:MAG: hypothetical protein AWM53_00195 [Candidatus Dichloromethanomonas elyunquensis]|nr:MAG: hypothetical protein AWM53_00195 [Candidatus Dichloromethanomonas elyunquensis]